MSKEIVGNLTSLESKYQWEIPNFRSYAEYENGQSLLSPRFRTCHKDKSSLDTVSLQWQLRIYPSGDRRVSKSRNKYISMYLESCDDFEVTTKYSLTFMENSNNVISRISPRLAIFKAKEDESTKKCKKSWGWCKFARKESVLSDQNQFLVNDTLTISCSIFETNLKLSNQESTNNICSEPSNHCENSLTIGDLSDVTIFIGNKSIQLHKAVLSSSSPVFQSMFINDAENNVSEVKITLDVDYNVIIEMFRYIYATKVNNIEKIASDLFLAANEYITGLKELCEKTVCENLNAENTLKHLELAVKYDVKKLKTQTIEFVVKNLKEIVRKEEFKSLSSDCKDELLIYMANNE